MSSSSISQAQTPVAQANTPYILNSTGCSRERPRVFFSAGRFLVWDALHVQALRVHRIVGALIGALPMKKRQGAELGIPLLLLFEEVLLALEEGLCEVVDGDSVLPPSGAAAQDDVGGTGFCPIMTSCCDWQADAISPLSVSAMRLAGAGRLVHAQIFRKLWECGFHVTNAAKFGGDFLVYDGDPFEHHAHLIIHVVPPARQLRAAERVCAQRLAASVKKLAVLACMDGASVSFTSLDAHSQIQPTDLRSLRATDNQRY
mmetsp:Transcript_27357/g.45618  ORF Transcript_27357/g.45618 Transcript_27357/m.45618 type:complete len:259 (+) Transcript_27357:156-932(+)|eukprot:CAMPEP_0119335488 /NCGR_PEP_ID=MMETSP1333-20130426/89704_1 /TAXON_ID=418940 /ORGANISM="Scyphosphaera apsteinii, Strain RCC1455" /LENGTH=258 /DNA_ID=CAMNT_0007346045 /DNA_START=153 /DNA_END=929 /DNA_ORIENTATION=+